MGIVLIVITLIVCVTVVECVKITHADEDYLETQNGKLRKKIEKLEKTITQLIKEKYD